ncbi:hypothetical protein Psfp_02321 [Pelotomaculum sp. FP]|nr:hypothetical protein Psfp_02321 [Pelotomaculum sp. FP]
MSRKSRCETIKIITHNVPTDFEYSVLEAVSHGQQSMIRLIAESVIREIKEQPCGEVKPVAS